MWLYGSGFPKSMNIGLQIDKRNGVESPVINMGKSGVSSRAYQSEETTTAGEYTVKEAQNKWKGWGTALKPSFEPIIVARKPFKGSLVDNVIEYGVGGINIDECRIETNGELIDNHVTTGTPFMRNKDDYEQLNRSKSNRGRFPANTILTYDETDFDEVCGGFPNTKSQKRDSRYNKQREYTNTYTPVKSDYRDDNTYEDSGSASRYFYCAKASKKDRDEGLESKIINQYNMPRDDGSIREVPMKKNIHPTVKPTELMQYLVRLVTPKNGTILDPFNGSGSTGKAAMYENKERNKNYKYIGIELTEKYLDISKARIEFVHRLIDKEDIVGEQDTQITFKEMARG